MALPGGRDMVKAWIHKPGGTDPPPVASMGVENRASEFDRKGSKHPACISRRAHGLGVTVGPTGPERRAASC